MNIKINALKFFAILLILSVSLTSCSSSARKSAWSLTKKSFIWLLKEISLTIIIECTLNDCLPSESMEENNSNTKSLENFVEDHYALIEKKEYALAWNNFSTDFKDIQEEKGGYRFYSNLWNSIDRASVMNFKIDRESIGNQVISVGSIYQDKITAHADIYYENKSSSEFIQSVKFYFVWDVKIKNWTIDGIDILEERPVP